MNRAINAPGDNQEHHQLQTSKETDLAAVRKLDHGQKSLEDVVGGEWRMADDKRRAKERAGSVSDGSFDASTPKMIFATSSDV